MALYIMVIILIINLKEEASLQTHKDKFIRDNGKMVSNRERDFGKEFMDKLIWANGEMESLKAMESLSTKMVIDMKGNSKTPWNLVKEFKDLLMEIFIRVIFKMINQMGTVNIIGKTKVILKDIFLMVFVKVKDYGKREPEIVINIKVNIKAIKNGDMEFLLGQMVISIKAVIKETWEMVMDKCFGKMGAIIKDNGKAAFNMGRVNYLL